MDEPLDPSSVAPHKLEEARRRTAVVAEFAKLERPTRALVEAYASRLGIGPRFFNVLVQVYREHGTVVRPRKAPQPPANPQISAEVDAEINAVIADLGGDVELATITAQVKDRCSEKGLPIPSWSAVRTRVRRARREGAGSASFPHLVLDRTALDFNVSTPKGPMAAWLTVLIRAPDAKVLAFHLSVGGAGPAEAAKTLLSAIGSRGEFGLPVSGAVPAIALYRTLDEGWELLSQALDATGVTPVGPVAANVRSGTAITRLLGDRIGRIALRPRLGPHRAAPNGGEGSDLSVVLATVTAALKDHLDEERHRSANLQHRALAAQLKRIR